MSTTKLHPFDYAQLGKGTWIETSELELASGRKCTHPMFGRAVLRLREMIETNTGILSRIAGERLRLMTDAEAVEWLIRETGRASNRLERNAYRLQHNIDRARLSPDEQTQHEHAVKVISMMAESQRAARLSHERLFSLAYGASLPQGEFDPDDD
jgi:hypothetical protein